MNILVPDDVMQTMEQLKKNGFEAYVVGGAVRDALLGLVPADWDLTTNANTAEIKRCFPKHFDTGVRHGTVTVLLEGGAVEVTTYRVDGVYADHRRPESVHFTSSLQEDLKRRDFTINAMAYGDTLIDPYGGVTDLKDRCIRCVGDPRRRFDEDALRILRGLRFAARLDFSVERQTLSAMGEMRHLLQYISAERIREELFKLLCTDCGLLLLKQSGVLEVILPELEGCNVAEMQRCLSAVPPRPDIRLATLFGMGGKTADAPTVLTRLKVDNTTKKTVLLLAEYAVKTIATAADLRRVLCRMGDEITQKLLLMRHDRSRLLPIYEEIVNRKDACSIRQLCIDGGDLLALGFRGKAVGLVLKALLEQVLDQPALNRRDTLLRLAEQMRR